MKQVEKLLTPKVISAFAPVQLPPEQEKTNVYEEDIVDTLIIDTYETDEEGNVRPITKQIVTGKKNRKEYIESFSDECGVENIVKKIAAGAISEDKYSILNGQSAGQVNDLRGFDGINGLADIESLARKAQFTFANLDPELKKNMSFAQFCQSFNNADLMAYVKAKTTVAQPSQEEGK